MRRLAVSLACFALLIPISVRAFDGEAAATPNARSTSESGSPTMIITLGGSLRPVTGPAEHFTGAAQIVPLFQATESTRATGGSVTFEPGARSAWHTHPRGQVLIVTGGVGRAQQWGEPVREIREGDVVRTPPGVKHWHGAAPDSAMTHIAIQEGIDGKVVDWLEKVSDEQYAEIPATSKETNGDRTMPDNIKAPSNPYADIAPALGEYTVDVLFGDVWKRPGLSPRDRSLITVATLVALYRTNELPFHLQKAIENGVTKDELIEVITHLAFYAGWPPANTAITIARDVFGKEN